MNDFLRDAVWDALDYLVSLQNEDVRPREARARLQALRGQHPDLRIDLLTEEQAFDHSFHYDALLRCAAGGTISLSYCPERALPWPLRGVHRWKESDLVRVNDSVLPVDSAMACLDFIWEEAPVIERLVNMCIIQEELERDPIDLTDSELQEAMDKFRSAKMLFKAENTTRWLEQHGMSHEKLERYVADHAVVPKLRDRIAGSRVDEYFNEHPRDFDAVRIAQIQVPDETHARDMAERIRAGEQDFFAAAERVFFDAAERDSSPKASLFATIDRRETEPAIRDQLFAASRGELFGPIAVEGGYAVMRVLAVIPAKLDDRTRTAVKEILFKEWLAERRKTARIEWCWGAASKTAGHS